MTIPALLQLEGAGPVQYQYRPETETVVLTKEGYESMRNAVGSMRLSWDRCFVTFFICLFYGGVVAACVVAICAS